MPKTCLILFFLFLSHPSFAQAVDLSFLQTRPEETGFEATSSHADVMAFLDVVAASSEPAHVKPSRYVVAAGRRPPPVGGEVAALTAVA